MKTAFKTCVVEPGIPGARQAVRAHRGGIPLFGSTARVADGALVVT
jgi:hypothetical protein